MVISLYGSGVPDSVGSCVRKLGADPLGIPAAYLVDSLDQLAERHVALLDQDTSSSQQPATVVRKTQVERLSEVDVLHPSAFFRYPDAAPAEDLARHIGVELPLLFLLEQELGRGARFTADIV